VICDGEEQVLRRELEKCLGREGFRIDVFSSGRFFLGYESF